MDVTEGVLQNSHTFGTNTFRFALVLISTPLIVLTILGNSLVVLVWMFHRPIRKPQNAYFFSLAIVDLLTGLFAFPLTVAYNYSGRWDFGLPMCRLWMFSCFSFNSMSAFHLVVIASDRYRVLTEGVSYLQRRSLKSVCEIVIVIWVLGLWVTVPILLDWEHTSVDPTAQRHCLSKKIPYWVVHIWFSAYGFPAFLLIRIYSQVFLQIRKRIGLRNFEDVSAPTNPSSNAAKDSDDKAPERSLGSEMNESRGVNGPNLRVSEKEVPQAKSRMKLAREKKSTITLGIIIGAFLICGAPWYSLTLYDILVPVEYKASPYLILFAVIFALANSCFNPIIYAARVPEFQNAIKKICRSIRKTFCSTN